MQKSLLRPLFCTFLYFLSSGNTSLVISIAKLEFSCKKNTSDIFGLKWPQDLRVPLNQLSRSDPSNLFVWQLRANHAEGAARLPNQNQFMSSVQHADTLGQVFGMIYKHFSTWKHLAAACFPITRLLWRWVRLLFKWVWMQPNNLFDCSKANKHIWYWMQEIFGP